MNCEPTFFVLQEATYGIDVYLGTLHCYHHSNDAYDAAVTKEQNDPYIPSRRRRSEYSVLVLIARAGASLEGVTVGGDRSRF